MQKRARLAWFGRGMVPNTHMGCGACGAWTRGIRSMMDMQARERLAGDACKPNESSRPVPVFPDPCHGVLCLPGPWLVQWRPAGDCKSMSCWLLLIATLPSSSRYFCTSIWRRLESGTYSSYLTRWSSEGTRARPRQQHEHACAAVLPCTEQCWPMHSTHSSSSKSASLAFSSSSSSSVRL